jgi:hypothetical protein
MAHNTHPQNPGKKRLKFRKQGSDRGKVAALVVVDTKPEQLGITSIQRFAPSTLSAIVDMKEATFELILMIHITKIRTCRVLDQLESSNNS